MSKSLVLLLIALLCVASLIIAVRPSYAANTANSWVSKAPMPTPRNGLEAVGVDGKIYAIGGDSQMASGGSDLFPAKDFSGGITGANEAYDPSTDNWTVKTPMPTARMNFAVAAYQGKIYCIGGSNQLSNSWIKVNEVYDPTSNSWETKAPMPTQRTLLQANIVNGKIYCIGGWDSYGHYSTVNEAYDLATNTWNTKSPLLIATAGYASAVFEGKIFIIGGTNGYVGVNRTQIYDPQNDSWTLGAPPPVGEISTGAITSGVNASVRIYCFSGRTQIYDPNNDSWSIGTPSPENIGGTAATVDDLIYVIGGVKFTGDLNGDISSKTEFGFNQQYTPIGYGNPDPIYLLEFAPPQISFQSPLNQTYNDPSIPITFAVNKNITSVSYSLDGQQNVTITGNTTIANIPEGFHNVTVYANDTYGNVGSNTVTFTVEKPLMEIFGGATIIAVIAVPVAIACLIEGLIFFRRHRKTACLSK